MGFSLEPYYEAARIEAEQVELSFSLEELKENIVDSQPQFEQSLRANPDVAVIAEHKRTSPTMDDEHIDSDVRWTAEQYKKGGATALSILTQNADFGGELTDMIMAKSASGLPILRKDFISTEYQLYQAKAFDADAVLLIVGGLDGNQLRELYEAAGRIGLDCLVEVRSEAELDRALELEPSMMGINNRELRTSEVDLDITRKLIEIVPVPTTLVAESGYDVKNPDHIQELRELQVDAVLMGTSLMTDEDPAASLAKWLN